MVHRETGRLPAGRLEQCIVLQVDGIRTTTTVVIVIDQQQGSGVSVGHDLRLNMARMTVNTRPGLVSNAPPM